MSQKFCHFLQNDPKSLYVTAISDIFFVFQNISTITDCTTYETFIDKNFTNVI